MKQIPKTGDDFLGTLVEAGKFMPVDSENMLTESVFFFRPFYLSQVLRMLIYPALYYSDAIRSSLRLADQTYGKLRPHFPRDSSDSVTSRWCTFCSIFSAAN